MEPRTEPLTETQDGASRPFVERDGGLLAIGFFKLAKCLFFLSVGLGAIHLLHRDLADEITGLAEKLHLDSEGRMVSFLLERVDVVDSHRLRLIGLGSFAYAAVALTEGVGLLMQKVWAEYLTLGLTVSLLPWELWELFRDPGWVRLGLLLVNVAVLGYLVWLLRRKRRGIFAA